MSRLPEPIRPGFATAMGESLYLAAAALVVGVVATFFLVRPAHQGQSTAVPVDEARVP